MGLLEIIRGIVLAIILAEFLKILWSVRNGFKELFKSLGQLILFFVGPYVFGILLGYGLSLIFFPAGASL
jgi:hypothetical protein